MSIIFDLHSHGMLWMNMLPIGKVDSKQEKKKLNMFLATSMASGED